MKTEETYTVDNYHISCNGEENGHPKVYLQIPPVQGQINCPYCSRIFVYATQGQTS